MQSESFEHLIIVCILLVILSNTVCSQAENIDESKHDKREIRVTYIANEGVLIKTKNKQILIDGLHRKYRDAYAFPPDELREILENARKPYANIDLLLVSHLHRDHFHPSSIGNYLKTTRKL